MFPYRSIAFFSFTPLEDISRRLIWVDEFFTAEKKKKNSNRETKATSHEQGVLCHCKNSLFHMSIPYTL